jgi:WD40 repeat protein
VVRVDGRDLLASGGNEGTVRLWDPGTGDERAAFDGHEHWVDAVCVVRVDGRDLLASGGQDGTVRLWDPGTGAAHAVLEGHQDWVDAVCAVTVAGRDLLASGSDDRTVRLWDPRTGACLLTVPTQYSAQGLASVAGSLAIGLDAGILVIRLNPSM